jgi:hypothetical protein
VRDIVQLMRLTGMRSDEVCQMRPCDANTEEIDPAGVRWKGLWVYTPGHHKTEAETGEVKVIFLGPKCQEIVWPYLERQPEAWCFSPRGAVAARWKELGRRYPRSRSRQPGACYTPHAVAVAITRLGLVRRRGGRNSVTVRGQLLLRVLDTGGT